MNWHPIQASSIYSNSTGIPHALRSDRTVYTGGILPKNKLGVVVEPKDVAAQARQAFENLSSVLATAGVRMEDVAKLNCYVQPDACRRLGRIFEVRDRFLQRGEQAGGVFPITVPEPGALIAIEAIAHCGEPKQAIMASPGTPSKSGWADAVRVADKLYGSAQYGQGETFSNQAQSAYDAFDAIVKAARVSWRDVVRVHQFATHSDIVFDETRVARAPYLRNEEFLSTSVVCKPAEIVGSPPRWELVVEIEAALAAKTYSCTPGIWSNPGGLHIVKSGNTAYFCPQMSRNGEGERLFPDDPYAHTDLICRNLHAMMETANLDWANVVHAKTFCRYDRDVPIARRVLDRWLAGSPCARTELVVDFFNPQAIVELELTGCV